MDNIQQLKQWIDGSDRIVFFGGAGVSTESGIPDFRSVDGLYNQKYDYPPETILSHSFFMAHPEEYYKFHRDKLVVDGANPNRAHLRLAELEREGKHAEHRRPASGGREQECARTARQYPPLLLHALRPAVSGGARQPRHRCAAL